MKLVSAFLLLCIGLQTCAAFLSSGRRQYSGLGQRSYYQPYQYLATIPRGSSSLALLPARIAVVDTNDELDQTARFFIKTFWDCSGLPAASLEQLQREQRSDWINRYGEPNGRSGRSTDPASGRVLLSAKQGGQVVGCVSISVGPYSRITEGRQRGTANQVYDPRKSSKASSIADSDKGASSRQRERPKQSSVPLVANLAVARKQRRKGLGAKLVRRTEELARDWGYDELVLLVDSDNTPAQRLYTKLGYTSLWRIGGASKLQVASTVRTVRAVNVAMAKDLEELNPFTKLLAFLGM